MSVICCRGLFARRDSARGANVGASAAVNTDFGVDGVLLAFGDSTRGAVVKASAASNTIVANYVSHGCVILRVNNWNVVRNTRPWGGLCRQSYVFLLSEVVVSPFFLQNLQNTFALSRSFFTFAVAASPSLAPSAGPLYAIYPRSWRLIKVGSIN